MRIERYYVLPTEAEAELHAHVAAIEGDAAELADPESERWSRVNFAGVPDPAKAHAEASKIDAARRRVVAGIAASLDQERVSDRLVEDTPVDFAAGVASTVEVGRDIAAEHKAVAVAACEPLDALVPRTLPHAVYDAVVGPLGARYLGLDLDGVELPAVLCVVHEEPGDDEAAVRKKADDIRATGAHAVLHRPMPVE